MSRFYEREVTRKYPSVTTICGVMDKGVGLLKWYASLGYEEAAKVYREAGERGTRVHEYIGDLIDGRPAEPSWDEASYVDSFRKFQAEKRRLLIGPCRRELTVFSDKYGYAGKLDYVNLRSGLLIDWKTSSAIRDEYWLQCAAYAVAYEEMTGEKINNICIVRLDKDGTYEVKFRRGWGTMANDFVAFLGLLDAFNWRLKRAR